MASTIVHLNLDTLIEVVERRPESKARAAAWEWLAPLASVELDYDGKLIVDSATWSHTWYRATPDSCTCPASANGRDCWHMEAAAIVAAVIEEDAAIDAAAQQEDAAAMWSVAPISQVPTRHNWHSVSYTAAITSGIADLF